MPQGSDADLRGTLGSSPSPTPVAGNAVPEEADYPSLILGTPLVEQKEATMTDPEGHNAAEDLDEDRLRLDPLEEGMDPPEHWSQAMEHGTTPREEREGEDLDQRLREEQPDIQPTPEPVDEIARMDAAGELEGQPADGELPFARELDQPSEEARRGQTADEGAGSVARELRTPRG
jgi:hypothetical protein